jgi:hypothetical protein
MDKIPTHFLDTETCGLHGVPVLLQHAQDDGEVSVHHLWKMPIYESMKLIEEFVEGRVVAHNLRFDWFHLSKWYNMMYWLLTRAHIEDIDHPINLSRGIMAEAEWQSQFGPCLKPASAIDTLLLASKGEDQAYLMDTKAIYVRRIPIGMAEPLCEQLNLATDLPWILFAGKKNQEQRWTVCDNTDRRTGEVDPYWKDIKISFNPSKSLKDLAVFLCDHEPPKRFADIAPPEFPAEEGYAPFATLLSNESKDWLYPIRKKQPNGQYRERLMPTWPALVYDHIEHWSSDLDAQAYAEDDIHMLRKLYQKFGSPLEDEDGMVACQVASVRLRGFDVNMEGVETLRNESLNVVGGAEINVNSPKQVAGFVAEALDPMEQLMLREGCNQKVIDAIKIEFNLDEEEECYCDEGKVFDESAGTFVDCVRCEGKGSVGPGPMPVVGRVQHIEAVRKHTKRVELFDKLRLARRAYPDFNVIGTKSGRMSGASGLNFQGIDHSDAVRSLFTLAGPSNGSWDCPNGTELVLSAGDYESQELAIAATAMRDEDLMEDMASGKKLHGLFAAQAFETTYEDIMSNKDDGRYGKGKGGVFAILYGGTFETVAKNMGIEVEVAEAAYNRMVAKYPQMGNTRKKITERFSSMHQTDEGKIEYRDPPEKFIESVFGFRRYFDTEYEIQRMILSVIKNMPPHWKDIELKVERKEGRLQSMSGALCSALYGAAFSIQNKIIRASNNHVIQSTGRHLTVGMQAAVWSLQPTGIHPFRLTLMSIHDELAVVCPPQYVDKVNGVIEEKVTEQCETVPLTCINWFNGNKSWAEKGDGANGTFYGWQP